MFWAMLVTLQVACYVVFWLERRASEFTSSYCVTCMKYRVISGDKLSVKVITKKIDTFWLKIVFKDNQK